MDDHLEDIKKLDEILKLESESNTFEEELQDCLNYNISDEEQLDGYDSDSSFDLDISENALLLAESRFLNLETINFSEDLTSIKHYLTPEEAKAINSCKDSKLKRLLLLNRAKNIHLKATQRKLYEKMKECAEAMLKTREHNSKTKQVQSNKHVSSRLGHPYFKTKDMFWCAPNADVARRKSRKEICVDYLPMLKMWSIEDRIVLKRSICFNYTNHRIKEYEMKLDLLNASQLDSSRAHEFDTINSEIDECREYINKWGQSDAQDVPPLSYEGCDWSSIAEEELKGRHSAISCKGMWSMVLHPSINKSEWSDEENETIQKIAKVYRYQNWDRIAKDLNTDRTAFSICVHFYSTLQQKYSSERFDPEEDRYLKEIVELCRMGNYIPWTKVAQHFHKRNRSQLYARYHSQFNMPFHKKGSFSEEEDVLLLVLMKRFGTKFSRICDHLPYRSRAQVANRCKNNLIFEQKLGAWSESDDTIIVQHVGENGTKSWSKLISKMPFRNSGQIRHRYRFIQLWLSKNPGKTLSDIPRKESFTKYEINLPLLKKFADMFDDYADVPTLDDVKLKLKTSGYKRAHRTSGQYFNTSVDDELLQYFQSSHKLRTAKVVTKSDFKNVTNTVKSLLALLKVTVTVPDKESLASNTLLDNVDKEILSHIFHNAYAQYNNTGSNLGEPSTSQNTQKMLKIDYKMSNGSVSLIPPNINTLVGMRSMLIKYSAFKSKVNKTGSFAKTKNLIKQQISLDLSQQPVGFQNLITMERDDFKDRLKVLFKWPAIMSISEPQRKLTILDVPAAIKQVAKRNVATRGRPRKDYSKIALMNKCRLEKRLVAKSLEKNVASEPEGKGGDLVNLVEKLNPNSKIDVTDESKFEFVDVNPSKRIKLMKDEGNDDASEDVINDLEDDIRQLDGIIGSECNND